MMAPLHLSVPVRHRHAQYQSPRTGAAKWNIDIIYIDKLPCLPSRLSVGHKGTENRDRKTFITREEQHEDPHQHRLITFICLPTLQTASKWPGFNQQLLQCEQKQDIMNFFRLLFTAVLSYWQWLCYFVIGSILINFSSIESLFTRGGNICCFVSEPHASWYQGTFHNNCLSVTVTVHMHPHVCYYLDMIIFWIWSM